MLISMISLKPSEDMHFYLWIIIKGIIFIVITMITGPGIIYNKIIEKLKGFCILNSILKK